MSNHECQRCGEPKAADEMVVRGGKPSKTCIECFRAAMAERGGRKSKAGGTKTRKARKAEPVPQPVTITGPKLELLPGFGFRASVEDDFLMIEQDAGGGDDARTDSLTLSRTEAKVLFAQFQDWAHS